MPFKKGQPRPKTAGRKKGSVNKSTASTKAALMAAFDQRGGVPALLRWAKDNETEFYKLWGRMVPTEISGPDGGPVEVAQVWRFGGREVRF